MVAHLSIPVLHIHAPHIEQKSVHLQIRAGMLALALALMLTLAATVAWTVLPQAAANAGTAVSEWSTALPSTTGWQYPRETPSYHHMYGRNVKAPSVDYMYAKPRPRSFSR